VRRVVIHLALLSACSAPAAKQPESTTTPEPVPVATPAPKQRPAREAFEVAPSPTSIVVSGDSLVWTDGSGSIWTMPTTGGTPKQLGGPQDPDFAFKIVAAGDTVIGSTRRDLLHVDLSSGAEKANVSGLVEYPEEIVADDAFVYLTMFKKPQIMRVPVGGGSAKQIGELARGVLAHHGDTLYAVSYATGVLVAIPKAGGKPRTIARGLVRPTALAVDATHAFAYSEKDRVVHRIELASGSMTTIARGLVNSDDLVSDGPWLYTRSWDAGSVGSVVRIAKDGSSPLQRIGEDLAAPYNIAFDADAIYVTARDSAQIVRFEKAALAP
jgi:hypothetical protein